MQQYNCPKCNAPVVINDKFCWYCGTGNTWAAQQQATSPSEQAASQQAQPQQSPVEYKLDLPPQQPNQQTTVVPEVVITPESPPQQTKVEYKLETPVQPPPQQPRKEYKIEPVPSIDRETVNYNQLTSIRTESIYGENTSGMGKSSNIPAEIKHWNWGAFFLTWIWGIGNSTWIALIALIPIPLVQIVMAFILGVKGNEWAWSNKRWYSIEHFQGTQKTWCYWGIAFVIIQIIFVTLWVIFLAPFAYLPEELPTAVY